MSRIPDGLAHAYWTRACAAEIGIAIATEDIKKVNDGLAEYRTKAGNPEWNNFRLCLPKGGKEVWIVRNTVEVIRV